MSTNKSQQIKRISTDNTYIVNKQPTPSSIPSLLQKPVLSQNPALSQKPVLSLKPVSSPRTPNKIRDKNLVLTPNGKFFTDIGDEHETDLVFSAEETAPFSLVGLEICKEEACDSLTVEETVEKYEGDRENKEDKEEYCEEKEEEEREDEEDCCNEDTVSHSKRITDCRDRRCRFCPSYDPVYASAFQGYYFLYRGFSRIYQSFPNSDS